MDPAVAGSPVSAPPLTFEDGLGERRYTVGPGNKPLEILRLNSALSAVSSFDFALRERAGRLATFRHQWYGSVRAVEVDKLTSALLVVSDYVPGVRLSTLLAAAEKRSLPLDLDAARCLIRQLVWAVAAWQEILPDACHGAIGPERILVTPEGRLVIVEYTLGGALEQLRYTRTQYWKQLRVAVPEAPEPLPFDARVDVTQIGVVTLALILGRRLTNEEYPTQIRRLVSGAATRATNGSLEPISTELREWLLRVLQLDPNRSFASANDARADLDLAIGQQDMAAELGALRAFLLRCGVRDAADGYPITLRDTAAAEPAPDVDLGPRIEALKSFLARYPVRPPGDPVMDKPKPSSPPEEATAVPPPAPPSPRGESSLDSPLIASFAPVFVPVEAPEPAPRAPRRRWIAVWVGLAVVAALGLAGLRFLPIPSAETTGVLTVGTNPAGISVFIDGTAHGVTPVGVNLPPGNHVVELVAGDDRRRIPVTITAGGQVSQFLEFPQVAQKLGELLVRTDPARATVTVDGVLMGRSPLSVPDLTPGTHTVVLQHETGTVTERVLIESGRTASLVVSMAGTPSNAAGWISISAPADLQVYENNRFLGTSNIDRIMLPVGRHEIEVVNELLGFRAVYPVQVVAGQLAPIRIKWPQGTLALNAIPWAEVWIDGQSIGETPIASVSVPIGTHEIIFRHPELGERRQAVTVTVGKPIKIGVDLGAK